MRPKILRVQAPAFYPIFSHYLPARYVDKFGEVICTGPKVIRLNTLNFAQNFEFWLSPPCFSGTAKFLDYLLKLHLFSVIWQSITAIGPGSSEIWDLNEKTRPIFFGERSPILVGYLLSKITHFQSCLKVSRRSAVAARRYSAAKCQKQTNKNSSKTEDRRKLPFLAA